MKSLIVILSTLTLLVGCSGVGPKSEAVQQEEKAVMTKAEQAKVMNIDQEETFTSEVEAYRNNAIIPAASAIRVEDIYVEVGDHVDKGQLLARLDPTLYDQQVISLSLLRSDYERMLPVFEVGGISEQTLDQMKSSLDVQSKIVDDMKRNIELRAPISGVITLRNTEAGNLLDGRSIVELAQIDSLKVRVNISERYYPVVKLGMPVNLSVEIFGDRLFKGHVSLIHPTLDAATRTFAVEVTVPNKDKTLRPGMHANSTFNMGSKDAIMIPDIAIQKQFGTAENYIYVVENGVAQRRVVTKGRQVGSMVEVISGVKPGEMVITTAFSRITNGTKVDL